MKRTRGVIIGAGTGSGKTLAFYLPCLRRPRSRSPTGQAPAAYPRPVPEARNELLRDQLREAVSAALDVAEVLKKSGLRRIHVGAPRPGDAARTAGHGRVNGTRTNGPVWRKQGRDVVCPYLPCPTCGGDLLWSEPDRLANRDKLACSRCDLVLDGDVALTRKTLQDRLPDILFTTTEMLNQHATSDLGRLLGWRTGRGRAATPKLVLLDEVHTYSGVHGAQVALLLRRWRHSVPTPVTFVGLSATLRDASSFFAQLTGIDQVAIANIVPKADDMTAEGREYALAVRGDPVSGPSLLSTSIQTAMLYGRTMDPPGREYAYGSVGFLFTDDLDVTNRFYDDLRDAEGARGRYRYGRTRHVLAGLRSPDAPQESERYRDGQSWNLMQRIGWPLDPAAAAGELRIGRTSSQDAGVDWGADLIVATASLEVGFNDPRVGLVLQHKAPRDAASFIQRRGRAGRLRSTRPWTVVVLSDYGRDRLAYQAYDSLFAPELPARRLPVGNRSVLKMQGTQALLDWLALKLASRDVGADPRHILRAPRERQEPSPGATGTIAGLLQSTLQQQELQDDLARHICNEPCASRPMRYKPSSGSTPGLCSCRWFRPPCVAPAACGARSRKTPGPGPVTCSRNSSPGRCSTPSTSPRSGSTCRTAPTRTNRSRSSGHCARPSPAGSAAGTATSTRATGPGSRCPQRRRGASSTSSRSPSGTLGREPGPRPARGRPIRDRCR